MSSPKQLTGWMGLSRIHLLHLGQIYFMLLHIHPQIEDTPPDKDNKKYARMKQSLACRNNPDK